MRFNLKNTQFITVVTIAMIALVSAGNVFAQNKDKKVVQFTGIIVDQDGVTEIPGVHVYVPRSGRGTTTNVYGYFSMPALVGEEVIVSAIGYMKQNFIIPEGNNDRVNVLFKLEEDTVYLQNVDISLYVSELTLVFPSQFSKYGCSFKGVK